MYKYLFFLLSIVSGVAGKAQLLDSLLERQRLNDPQEKIYIQFDKSYYNAGETIWFKAYLFSGVEPSDASRNFYAELIDEQGKILKRLSAPVYRFSSSGSFDLDSSIKKNMVFFRAYTVPMLNSDTGFLYTKAIRILSDKAVATKASTSATISFMPEGGNWVAGLPSHLAFIATNQQGFPVNVSGTVSNSKGEKITEFKSVHDGMGRFLLLPEAGQKYTATWKDEGGRQYSNTLPDFDAEGITLQIKKEGNNNRFILQRSERVPDALKQLNIIGYMNQRMVFKASINLANRTSATGLFPIENLPTGLLQITLFDQANKPVAERITFINNHDYEFDGDAYIAQKNLAPRGLNKVEVTLSDTMPSNLSLAITDADLNEPDQFEDNIISNVLLTGDLKGKVFNPYYYFYSTDDSAAIYLDLVMQTHGWRRYNWTKMVAGEFGSPKFKETNFLSLKGQVAGLPQGSYSPDLQLTGFLQTADSAKTFINVPIDRKGQVSTEGLVFFDKAKLYFNFNKKSLLFDKSMLMLDNGLYKGYQKALLDTSYLKAALRPMTATTIANNARVNKIAVQNSRQALIRSQMLENVTVTAKAKTTKDKMEEKYVSGLFSGDGRSFDLVNDPLASSYMTIFQYLQGKVAGLMINTGAGTPTLTWRGGTPALYLNEMQTDASMIESTPVSDIAYVKVLRPGESVVSGGGGGVIAIYTRKGGDSQPDPNAKGLSYIQLMGYTPVKEFYSPNYATPSGAMNYDDVRTTLYWNPYIFLDKTRKKVQLQFYNNDITKRYRLILEGANAEGKLIHVEKIISQ